MPVLVDGNNLIFAARQVDPTDLLIGRSMLCAKLGDWARRRRERVHVVFDGPEPEASLAEQLGDPDITVTYSGRGVSADRRIHELIAADSAARRLVVVSSDREVMAAARRRDARPMRADDFWRIVVADLSRPEPRPLEPPEKRTGLAPDQTDEWLRDFGLEDDRVR